MQYMLLIYEDNTSPKPGSPEWEGYLKEYGVFTEEVKAKGVFIAGDALQPVTTATTVRVRGGKAATTDGPFAETKEMFAGYYLLDCKDLDEAIEYAEKIPSAKYGAVEVRPVMVFD